MTEETTPPKVVKLRRRRKPARRLAPPRAIPVPTKADQFPGLTRAACSTNCSPAKGCCITGTSHCGHPAKGGLQGAEMSNPAIVERFNEARKVLEHASVEKRRA